MQIRGNQTAGHQVVAVSPVPTDNVAHPRTG
jgi:hypothetical protein